jgi:hypothetical protein
MRIVMIGTGYVRLASGTCFSDFGRRGCCFEKDADKIAALLEERIPIFEPDLDELVAKNVVAGRLNLQARSGRGVVRRGCGVHRRGHAVAARRQPRQPELCLCSRARNGA